jgi:hypothetical protein
VTPRPCGVLSVAQNQPILPLISSFSTVFAKLEVAPRKNSVLGHERGKQTFRIRRGESTAMAPAVGGRCRLPNNVCT